MRLTVHERKGYRGVCLRVAVGIEYGVPLEKAAVPAGINYTSSRWERGGEYRWKKKQNVETDAVARILGLPLVRYGVTLGVRT